jgi:hypothetical protein
VLACKKSLKNKRKKFLLKTEKEKRKKTVIIFKAGRLHLEDNKKCNKK